MQIIETIIEAKKQESKEQFIVQSFSGWQITETIKNVLITNRKPIAFGSYLKQLGLKDEMPAGANAQKTKAKAAAAIQNAEEVKQLDKAQQKGGSS